MEPPTPTTPSLEEMIQNRKEQRRKKVKQKISQDRVKIESHIRLKEAGVDPLSLLTEDDWRFIFDYLTCPKDLANVWDTCPLFREVLSGSRVERILFPLALEVDTFWLTLLSKCPNQLLNLRQICSKWRSCIDNLYLKRLERFGIEERLGGENETGCLRAVVPCVFDVEEPDLEKINKMVSQMREMRPHKKFHLINGSVLVNFFAGDFTDIEDLDLFDPLIEGISNLLELCGEQVYDFSFKIMLDIVSIHPDLGAPRFYSTLWKWLNLMPNLKTLNLSLCWNDDDRLHEIPNLEQLVEQMITLLQSIEKLTVRHMLLNLGKGRAPLLGIHFSKGIIDSCPQLKELELDVRTGGNDLYIENLIPSIYDLRLESFSLSVDEHGQSGLMNKLSLNDNSFLNNSSSSLKSISLSFSPNEIISFQGLFSCLEQYPSIQKLELHIPKYLSDRPGAAPLQLLKVKEINLSLGIHHARPWDFNGVDFLIDMEELEKITWRIEPKQKTLAFEPKEIIKFRGGLLGNLYDSNIWDIFRSLMEVNILDGEKVKKYHRRLVYL